MQKVKRTPNKITKHTSNLFFIIFYKTTDS